MLGYTQISDFNHKTVFTGFDIKKPRHWLDIFYVSPCKNLFSDLYLLNTIWKTNSACSIFLAIFDDIWHFIIVVLQHFNHDPLWKIIKNAMAKTGQLKISSWWNLEWAIVVWNEEKNARHPIEKCELKKVLRSVVFWNYLSSFVFHEFLKLKPLNFF